MASYLLVALDGSSPFLEVHSFQDGVLSVFAAYLQYGFLPAAFTVRIERFPEKVQLLPGTGLGYYVRRRNVEAADVQRRVDDAVE